MTSLAGASVTLLNRKDLVEQEVDELLGQNVSGLERNVITFVEQKINGSTKDFVNNIIEWKLNDLFEQKRKWPRWTKTLMNSLNKNVNVLVEQNINDIKQSINDLVVQKS